VSTFIRRSLFIFAVLACVCYAQTGGSINVFNGEIRGEARGAMTVELVDKTTDVLVGRSSVDSDGHFVIRDVAPGAYAVRFVPNPATGRLRGDEVSVSVDQTEKSAEKPGTGTISAGTLMHPPSKKASKVLLKAQKYSEAGDSLKAIETLKSAPVEEDSASYIHSRLGTEYLKLHHYAQAVPELEEAVKLAPKEQAHHSNLSYAYRALGRLDRAEAEARAALDLDRGSARAHFMLGSVLLERNGGFQEAVENLKLARREVPSARFLLAQAYLFIGQKVAAQAEIHDFMEVATDAQREAAQSWLDAHSYRAVASN
jgi:tetratricopeptide (TPR) repeat protein